MKDLGLFVEKLCQGELFLFSIKFSGSLDLLSLIKSPSLELIIEDFEVIEFLRVHASLYFGLMLGLLLFQEFLLPTHEFLLFIVTLLSESVGELACEPPTNSALDVESGILTLPLPHFRREVGLGVDDLILSTIDVEVFLFHLGAKLSHHDGRFCLVLVGLHNTLVSFRVIGGSLICLGKGMMIGLASFVVPETANIGLGLALLLNLNSHDLNLVVGKTDLDLKHSRHHELVGLNRIKIVLLLLLGSRSRYMYLILLPKS